MFEIATTFAVNTVKTVVVDTVVKSAVDAAKQYNPLTEPLAFASWTGFCVLDSLCDGLSSLID